MATRRKPDILNARPAVAYASAQAPESVGSKNSPQVHSLLSSLEIGVGDLEALAAALEDRLAHVVRPIPQSNGCDGGDNCGLPPAYDVPLSERISNIINRVAAVRANLADVTDRLEV